MNNVHEMTEQEKQWNGPSGKAWVEGRELLDRILQPYADLLVDDVSARPVTDVLDVGCGNGATTLAISERLGPESRVVGIDISAPMLEIAAARAGQARLPATFILANAETYPFEAGTFDAIVSRFGVMFFDDPNAAFKNLKRTLKKGGTLHAVAWRSAAENPFMTAAERAAAPLLPNLPARKPSGPGQFAFADATFVREILERSGWTAVRIDPIDVESSFPERELDRYVMRLGPVGIALHEADDETRARVGAAVRAAFAPYVQGSNVRFSGACWHITAIA
jgi:SAM-dependent methyltransferase